MKSIVLGAALILAAVVAAVSLAAGTPPNARDSTRVIVSSNHGNRVVGYFIEWGIYGRAYRSRTSRPAAPPTS